MAVLRRTAQAEEDLVEIWVYIALDNPEAADRVLDDLYAKYMMLAENPHLGPARPDIAPELRYLPVGRYPVLYREIAQGIEVVRVAHGARRLADLF